MKKAWFLVLQYILFLFVGSLLGVFIYTQYYSNINLVAGFPVAFSKYPLVKGLFVFLPIVLLIMGMYLSLYKVRHFSNPISCAIFYSCLGLLTWLVFLPLTLKCINYVNPMVEKIAEAEPENILSRGYFILSKSVFSKESRTLSSSNLKLSCIFGFIKKHFLSILDYF